MAKLRSCLFKREKCKGLGTSVGKFLSRCRQKRLIMSAKVVAKDKHGLSMHKAHPELRNCTHSRAVHQLTFVSLALNTIK